MKFNPGTLHISRSDMMLDLAHKFMRFHETEELTS